MSETLNTKAESTRVTCADCGKPAPRDGWRFGWSCDCRKYRLERIFHASKTQVGFCVLHPGNWAIGFIRKFKEDRCTKTPWQAFRGVGASTFLVGSFYGPTGQQDAINAILKSAR